VVKALLAGADVAMSASALLRHGPHRLAELMAGLEHWLEDNEFESVEQLKGSMSQQSCPDPAAFERGHYMRMISTFNASRTFTDHT
jgi:dihydroorotate dehydrogenase (fumarate)